MIEDVVKNYEEYVLGRETGEAVIDKLTVQTNRDVDQLSQEVLAGLVQSIFDNIYRRFGEDEAEDVQADSHDDLGRQVISDQLFQRHPLQRLHQRGSVCFLHLAQSGANLGNKFPREIPDPSDHHACVKK